MKPASIQGDIVSYTALVVVVLVSWMLYPSQSRMAGTYMVDPGKPWPYDRVTAKYDFPIYKTDEQLQQEENELLSTFSPCYAFLKGCKSTNVMVLSASELESLQREGYTSISLIHSNHTAETIPLDKIYTPKSAYLETGQEYTPNLQLDTVTSSRLRATMLAGLSKTQGMVQAGERIIDRGDIVSPRTYQILLSYNQSGKDRNFDKRNSVWTEVFFLLLVLLTVGFFAVYLQIFRQRMWRTKDVLFFSLQMLLIIGFAFLLLRYADTRLLYLTPFVWVPIITRVFYDSRTAFQLHLCTSFIVALASPTPLIFFFIQLCAGGVAVASLKDITQRAQLARTALLVFGTYAITYTVFTVYSTGDIELLDWHVYTIFLFNAVLIICAYGVIYVFEKMFRLVSSITLLELANINSQLMHEFAEKAPGTFQHSLQVSNLATEAAKRIDANALLVRTGALYHDIGKMVCPENFTENQQGGQNPLLKMSNREAARIVMSHVLEGEHIARQHHLPEVIIQFIVSHHGTSQTRYFYNSEVLSKGAENVHIEDYTYPGPKPATKEAAILMMADAIEARSRSLKEYTEQSIGEMVDDMINLQVQNGQFSCTKLSFRDVETVRQVFKERLVLIYHHRIQYPIVQAQ